MSLKQKTIKEEVIFEGVGLHTGDKVKLVLKPANVNDGIRFTRVDLEGKPVIKADSDYVFSDSPIQRCTAIKNNGAIIYTIEHLMSVLFGLGITNLNIDIDGSEIPGLDGSGIEFLKSIKKVGVVEQDGELEPITILEPIGVEKNGSSILIVPSQEYKVSYTLDYNHPKLRSQFFSTTVDENTFEEQIAPCRTFCLESEANELKTGGLGKGANFTNTLVVGENGVIENKVRFEDEFARHKVLDFIGDLYLLGRPIKGEVFATKSGHYLNLQMLRKILEQEKRFKARPQIEYENFPKGIELDIKAIMKILPHRYPFLLVDRVTSLEQGKKGIGIKNVTINDQFFTGHFPTRPLMPGVMIVEAMAQVGGIVVLTNEAHRGKVALFMACSNVKFRKMVTPGDQLVLEVEVVKDKTKSAAIRGKAFVNGEIVTEADMLFSYVDASFLD